MIKMSTKDFINLLENLKDDVELNVSININPIVKKIEVPEQYAIDTNISQVKTFSEPLTVAESLKVYESNISSILEDKIAKAFNIQQADVTIKDINEPMYESRYYCSNTDSSIIFRHRVKTPPNVFTIEDRGITKTYTEYHTKSILDMSFSLDRPIIVVEQK